MTSQVEFWAILGSAVALFGWTIKHVLAYFFKSNTEMQEYIKCLVSENQKNVIEFTNTVNHQRTLDRETQERQTKAIECLAIEIKNSNVVNGKVLEFLSGK